MHLELRASLARKDLMQDVALGLNPEVSGEVACVYRVVGSSAGRA